jgi:hypothetical protein
VARQGTKGKPVKAFLTVKKGLLVGRDATAPRHEYHAPGRHVPGALVLPRFPPITGEARTDRITLFGQQDVAGDPADQERHSEQQERAQPDEIQDAEGDREQAETRKGVNDYRMHSVEVTSLFRDLCLSSHLR